MATIYYQKDCNLSLLEGKTIAIIGYGSQGHAHAKNAKESGCNVIIGLYKGSKSWAKAEAEGFEVYTAAEATKRADIVMILINDEKQAAMYNESVAPNLRPGMMLMFAHGFAIHFNQIVPPADVNVIMIAPKGPGHIVRRTYEEGQGVPDLACVYQDASGKAMDIALAYACGIGGGRAGIIESTFKTETETETPTTGDVKVAVVLKTLASEYWGYVETGCKAAADDLGVKVVVVGPGAESDIEGQVSMIEQQICLLYTSPSPRD